MCALELLAKCKAGGDNLVDTIYEGLQEQGWLKITNELRRFIHVDIHAAVNIGDLGKNSEAIKVVRPEFNSGDFPKAAVWEGVDELMLGEGEPSTWRSLLEQRKCGGHPCQAIYKGVEGAEWENLHDKFVGLNMEVSGRNPIGSSRAKTLWKVRDAKERGDTYHDQSYDGNRACGGGPPRAVECAP